MGALVVLAAVATLVALAVCRPPPLDEEEAARRRADNKATLRYILGPGNDDG